MKNELYLQWVRQQHSVVSGRFPCVAHHLIGHGRHGSGKTSDVWAMPLTPDEHDELHLIGWQAWEAKYGSQVMFALRTLSRAIEQGFFGCAVDGLPGGAPVVILTADQLEKRTRRRTKIDLRTRKLVVRTSPTSPPTKQVKR